MRESRLVLIRLNKFYSVLPCSVASALHHIAAVNKSIHSRDEECWIIGPIPETFFTLIKCVTVAVGVILASNNNLGLCSSRRDVSKRAYEHDFDHPNVWAGEFACTVRGVKLTPKHTTESGNIALNTHISIYVSIATSS